jgi:hypothetical protein
MPDYSFGEGKSFKREFKPRTPGKSNPQPTTPSPQQKLRATATAGKLKKKTIGVTGSMGATGAVGSGKSQPSAARKKQVEQSKITAAGKRLGARVDKAFPKTGFKYQEPKSTMEKVGSIAKGLVTPLWK